MSCGNCGKQFAPGLVKVHKILSKWEEPNVLKNVQKAEEVIKKTEIISEEEEFILPSMSSDPTGGDVELPSLLTSDLPLITAEGEIEEVEVTTSASATTASANLRSQEPQSTISICEALSVVFEIPPLSGKSYTDLMDEEDTVFPTPRSILLETLEKVDPDHCEKENPLDLCIECAEILTLLYNNFKDFTRICKLGCEVAKRLEELEKSRQQLQDAVEQNQKGGQQQQQQKKRVYVKKAKKGQQKAKVSSGSSKGVEIKKEFQSDMEMDEESDIDDLDDGYYVDSLSSSPPDSPVTMDFDNIPRSPRPVRNSSARNKDWSTFYKDDELFDDEDEEAGEEALGIDPDPDANTDANNTDADPGAETEAEAMEMLKNVEVEWAEDRDRDYDPDIGMSDDDDEEYRPDSDLEGLAEEGPKRKRHTRVRRRRHSSSYKSRPLRRSNSTRTPAGDFECLECGKYFAHKKSLERHCRTHTEDSSSVQCPTCNKDFSREDHLKRHRRVVHGEDIPMRYIRKDQESAEVKQQKQQKCPLCEESFNLKEIDEHIKTLHEGDENVWKCKDCPMEFSLFVDWNRHKSVHYERQKAKCEVCEKEFRGSYHMKRHQLSIHHVRSDKPILTASSDEEDEVEEAPAEVFDNEGNMMILIKKEKKTPKMFKCQECGKKYAKQDKLTEHLICHGIGDRYRCEVCGREFNHIRSKQRHMFLHSPDNPYKCTQEGCDKGFSRKDHFVRHLQNIHNIEPAEGSEAFPIVKPKKPRAPPEKEVQCPHCDKVIKRERLRLHMVIHTGEKRHMCDHCGQKFGLRTTLLTHIQCVHQGVRRYTCTYCGQAFKRSNHLKDHEKLHTDADSKPFVCNICGKAFRREKNLKSHMICHIGSKDYMCEICGKAFNRIDNMRAHVKTVHQGLCIRKKKPTAASAASAASAAMMEGQVTLEGADGNSVIMKVERQPATRKRQAKTSKDPVPTMQQLTTTTVTMPTAVLVAVDPMNPGVHQELEIRTEGDEDSNNSYETQRTTIVQLAPNQTVINPQNPGQPFQGNFTTFYQYTYF